MKTKLFAVIAGLLAVALMASFNQNQKQESGEDVPQAPEQYRRPKDFQPFQYKYSVEELKTNFSEELMQRAAERWDKINRVNEKGKYKPTTESINSHPTPEWFEDAKFGMFIDWGLWSIAGWAPQPPPEGLQRTYPDWYENNMYTSFKDYHEKNWGSDFKRDDFIPLFQARDYDPEKLVQIAEAAGMKYIVPFTKHCTGFCLWPSSFTQRDVGDMGPKRDLIKPLLESCKFHNMKFGFYLCQEEWEYPLLNEKNEIVNRLWGGKTEPYTKELEKKCSGKIPVRDYGKDYLVPLATEFIDTYDPDILWFDAEWKTTPEETPSWEMAAYFYNQAEGRKEVAVNDRFAAGSHRDIRGTIGDFYTDESGDMIDILAGKEHAWEECRGISSSYGFNWQDTEENVMSSKEFIDLFLDIVSNGGNFLLITNLDGQGALPKTQERRLRDIGKWLKINGEGIYGTRKYSTTSEGFVRYTRSKDNKQLYAIATEWPGKQLKLKSVVPKKESKLYMLGVDEPLQWEHNETEGVTTIKIPDRLQKESNRPCKYAYTFRIEL